MGKAGNLLHSLGIIDHYQSMSRGVIDTRDVVYFLALIAMFLLMTKTRIECRKSNSRILIMKKPFEISNPYLKLPLSIVLVVVAAWLLSVYFFRIDLTSEKRYTFSEFSKKTLRELDDGCCGKSLPRR